jgi:hypothetical protein
MDGNDRLLCPRTICEHHAKYAENNHRAQLPRTANKWFGILNFNSGFTFHGGNSIQMFRRFIPDKTGALGGDKKISRQFEGPGGWLAFIKPFASGRRVLALTLTARYDAAMARRHGV